jgi:hypothetical protein
MSTQHTAVGHDDLVLLTSYMAEHGYKASEVAYAVEKPWKFIDLLHRARVEQADRVVEALPDVERHPTLRGFY